MSQVHLQGLLETLPAAAYLCDHDGLITYFNHRAAEMWGRAPKLNDPADRFCGSCKLFAVDGTPISHSECWMTVALQQDREIDAERIIIERANGSRLFVLVHASPIHDERGGVVGTVNVLVDISDRTQSYDAQARLAAIVESSDDAIVSKTLDGTVTSWNAGAEKLFGYSPSEAIGQSITLIIPPDRLHEERMILGKIRQGERVEHYETVRIRKGGQPVQVSVSVSPIRDAKGRVIGASKIARDISPRMQAEAAAHDSERRFAALAELVPQLVWTSDPVGRVDYLNSRWYDYSGRTPDRALGNAWMEALHPDDQQPTTDRWNASLASGEPFECEYRLRAADGHFEWFLVRSVPLRDSQDRIVKWFGTCTGIQKIKQLEAALRDADRTKDEYLGMLGHELRNPLTVISNAIQVLARENVPEPQAKLCSMIRRQSQNLTRMVEDLLDVSRITHGRITLAKENIDLRVIFDRAVDGTRSLMQSQSQDLSISLGSEPLRLNADPTRLEQVLVNLLSNAAKYTERGGCIRLSADREDGEIVIRVEDDGIGISPQMLPRVFDLFVQGDTACDRSQGGLGIGLALVRSLVQLHEGTVGAYSAGTNQGAQFEVRLPALEVPTETECITRCTSAHKPHLRILVVDDQVEVAESVLMVLEELGHEVRMVHSGAAALDEVHRDRPDLMFVDLGMPGMSGYEVAHRLRSQPELSRLCLVALSGYGREDDRYRTREAGFNYHLVKPAGLEMIESLLSTMQRE
jgi:PAS domain S-box-containing protein